MTCQEAIDVMEDAIDECLEPKLRLGFEEHMEECAPCRVYLEQLCLTRQAMQLLDRGEGTIPRREELIDRFLKEFKR